jgi:hypothetical protein
MLSVLWTMRLMAAASSSVFGMLIMTGSAFRNPPDWARRYRVVRCPIESIWLWLTP